MIKNLENLPWQDGHRNVSGNKLEKDSDALLKALVLEKDDYMTSRYTFYLAQTLFSLGRSEEAMLFYRHRTQMGFWSEEVFYSYYKLGISAEKLGDTEAALNFYYKATEIAPKRAEALVAAGNLLETLGCPYEAFLNLQQASKMKVPDDALFVETHCYDFALDKNKYEKFIA
jgi:tetratricopeptide (TPR) repeat protein